MSELSQCVTHFTVCNTFYMKNRLLFACPVSDMFCPISSGHYPVSGLTVCQRAATEASENPASKYIPRCNKKGAFTAHQCDKNSADCWCVDSNGKEIAGSRRTHPAKARCSHKGISRENELLKKLLQNLQFVNGCYDQTTTEPLCVRARVSMLQ